MGMLVWMGMLLAVRGMAHDAPYSYVELRASKLGLAVRVEMTAIDAAHELADITPDRLMDGTILEREAPRLASLLNERERLLLQADGAPVSLQLRNQEVVATKQSVRLTLDATWSGLPKVLSVQGQLFPYDPRHKSFLTLYRNDHLALQTVLEPGAYGRTLAVQEAQSVPSVIVQFIGEGIHHIYLGPDHILFILGLVLLPASLKHLLKIVTAFTIAHSITLVSATLGWLNPPSRIIEPTIALSIVIVGIHALWKEQKIAAEPTSDSGVAPVAVRKSGLLSDPRMLFAFGFGLIHGFGFASALQEMELPRYALGWSLFAFNVGVEMGQACIVLAAAPLLALLRRYYPNRAMQVVFAGSVVVVIAGSFWFVQRILA